MNTVIHKRVEEARFGVNPRVIAQVPSGWVFIGDHQCFDGYCLLLPDPVVPNLNALSLQARADFLRDMVILGDAILSVTQAARCNYEILGNLDPALHAHVFPRYDHEPPELKTRPVWFYDFGKAPQFDFSRDKAIMSKIARELKTIYASLELKCEMNSLLGS